MRFVFSVKRTRCFVKEQKVRLVQEHARDCQPLLLARGKNAPPVVGLLQSVNIVFQTTLTPDMLLDAIHQFVNLPCEGLTP